jgi:hypothetical protein
LTRFGDLIDRLLQRVGAIPRRSTTGFGITFSGVIIAAVAAVSELYRFLVLY